jgi:NADH-quinone oxidoreductase subunit J
VTINMIILIVLVIASLWTVMTRSLLRAAIGLAAASAVLTILMFRLGSPLAAVFELSVCSGLISVLFVSTISMTEPLSKEEKVQAMKKKLARYWLLPLIIMLVVIIFILVKMTPIFKMPAVETITDVREVLWNLRQIDLIGQIIILLTGVFGVVVLFKERRKNE